MHKKNQSIISKTLSGTRFAAVSLLGLTLTCNAFAAPVFINEFHYDNSGTDNNEGVEIAGVAGTSLDDWALLFYNGGDGSLYRMLNLSGTIEDTGNGFGVLSFMVSGLQNGPNDGIALVDNNAMVQEFISYEGVLLATEGAANGMTSIDVGVTEPISFDGLHSVQRMGVGNDSGDFEWIVDGASFGSVNINQEFATAVPLPAALPLFLTGLCGLLATNRNHRPKERSR